MQNIILIQQDAATMPLKSRKHTISRSASISGLYSFMDSVSPYKIVRSYPRSHFSSISGKILRKLWPIIFPRAFLPISPMQGFHTGIPNRSPGNRPQISSQYPQRQRAYAQTLYSIHNIRRWKQASLSLKIPVWPFFSDDTAFHQSPFAALGIIQYFPVIQIDGIGNTVYRDRRYKTPPAHLDKSCP